MARSTKSDDTMEGLLSSGERNECHVCESRALRARQRRKIFFTLVRPLLVLVLALCVMVPLAVSIHNKQLERDYQYSLDGLVFKHTCGSTLDQAKRRGCTFDPLSVNWLPPQCSRGQHEEYLDTFPWPFYRNESGRAGAEVSLQQLSVMIGHETFYTTRREHLTHCAHMVMRGHKAFDDGKPLDKLSISRPHTQHCLDMLLHFSLQGATGEKDTLNIADVALGAC